MIFTALIESVYLISAVLLLVGLKFLNHPDRARKGVWILSASIVIAAASSMIGEKVQNFGWIFSGVMVGLVFAVLFSNKVKLSHISELLSFLNGLGSLSISAVAFIEFSRTPYLEPSTRAYFPVFILILCLMSGMAAFSGNLLSIAKIRLWIPVRNYSYPMQTGLNLMFIFLLGVLMFSLLLKGDRDFALLSLSAFFAFLYALIIMFPVIGTDMPVVIAGLNSVSGFSAFLFGLYSENQIMILTGTVTCAAGFMLARKVSFSMNRNLFSVFLGISPKQESEQHTGSFETVIINEINVSDAAIILAFAKRVVIVPGYGFAASQANHVCKELVTLLEEREIQVKFAIHPLAGRMPGHMNVLLSEAEIPYDRIVDTDHSNEEIRIADVCLVIGGNDIVNPAVLKKKKSNIAGLPLFRPELAKNAIILKRGKGKGFSGIRNEIFDLENVHILRGEAKNIIVRLANEIREI